MSIVILQVPEVKAKREERPSKCRYCSGETFQRWGKVIKPVRDSQLRRVEVYRYWCCRCHRTFRYYPEGVDKADQTQRMRTLAALFWMFGLSYRSLEIVLGAFQVDLSRMSAWRDVQERAEELFRQRKWGKVRVLGLDGAYVRGWGETQPVLVAIDLGNGQPVELGYVDEKDPQAVRRFLEPLVQRLGVSVIVTDDLASYRVVADQLELEHQVCQFHLRRWVGRSLRELSQTVPPQWQWAVEEVKGLIAELPIEGEKRLVQLWKQIPESRSTHRTNPIDVGPHQHQDYRDIFRGSAEPDRCPL
jgi:transposase-like protein